MRRLLELALVSSLLSLAATAMVRAQGGGDTAPDDTHVPSPDNLDPLPAEILPAQPGEEAEVGERRLWELVQAGRFIRAREAAEQYVANHPDSYVGHFVLGLAQHYGEANFPRALYEVKLARQAFERRYGPEPSPGDPWRWHARILDEQAQAEGDLDHFAERLAIIALKNRLYDPDEVAARAWPLMKLHRYREARMAAQAGLRVGTEMETVIGLNSLCAIEFEAGNDGESYTACRAALDYAQQGGRTPETVDLTNFAEASRSMFRFDEAERILLEATRARVSWYGNPWMELGELYTRAGRLPEALNALEQVPPYRAQRPAHVRESDRNETRRALAAFFLVAGRVDDALRITKRALVLPDRRAHTSRDPAQDRAIIALIDRRARLVEAERIEEGASARGLGARLWAWARAQRERLDAWQGGRKAARLLADEDRLVGTFAIGTSRSAITPPWLIGDLVNVLGAGVVRAAVQRARAVDQRPGAGAYYDAFLAEAAFADGDAERAVELAGRSIAALSPGDALLEARVRALSAAASWEDGAQDARAQYDAALQKDPGVFRRLGLPLPVHIVAGEGEVAQAVADAVSRSPRFEADDAGLRLLIEADASHGRVCLEGIGGSALGCGEASLEAHDTVADLAQRIVDKLHEDVFAPRLDLSQADANSLDGTAATGRDALHTLFDDIGLPGSGGGEALDDDSSSSGADAPPED
ncbi:MAG: hypothetical protein GW913_02040 [Myxococcales bacterium]|nr:hypothetical protein [Myxococcales bacterium]